MPQHRLTSDTLETHDALAAIELYHERGWTDGLPVVPPTPDAVATFLGAAALAPDHVLGVEPTKGVVTTARRPLSTPSAHIPARHKATSLAPWQLTATARPSSDPPWLTGRVPRTV